ncbi:hypothetical protein GCM10027271_22290 [Saccharopolyspora gloriosae]
MSLLGLSSGAGGGTSAFFSLRDLFPKWLRHEGKSCPREKNAENPRVVVLLWWSLLSGFAADKRTTNNALTWDDKINGSNGRGSGSPPHPSGGGGEPVGGAGDQGCWRRCMSRPT